MNVKERLVRRGAVVVAIWAAINAVNAAYLFGFEGSDATLERSIYWSSVGIIVLAALAIFLVPVKVPARTAPPGGTRRSGNGAPSAAFAIACMFAGMAWVWGIFLVWFAMPLVIFCLARWRVERVQRRQGEWTS